MIHAAPVMASPPPPASIASDARNVTFALTAALIALPFLQALPLDFDRTAPLVLLLPTLWSGRRFLFTGVHELFFSTSGSLPRTSFAPGSIGFRVALLALSAAVVGSTILSDHVAASAATAATWILLTATAVIAGQINRRNETTGRSLLAGLALGSAFGAVAVWILWIAGGRGAIPLYAHHRLFGLHVLVGALASTALIVRRSANPQRMLWLAAGAITWGAVLWSGGRAPLVALAGGLAMWFMVRRSDRKPLAAATTFQLLAGLAVSAAFWTPRAELGWWHAFARTVAATNSGGAVNVSVLTSTRSDFWRDAAQHALTSPWIGHGPDAYRFLVPKLDGQQPHNFPLQLWLDLGWLGAAPALLLLGSIILAGWAAVWLARPRGTGETSPPSRFVEPTLTQPGEFAPWAALLTTLILAGLLDGVFYHVLTLLPAMLAIGVLLFAGTLQPRVSAYELARPLKFFASTAVITAGAVSMLHALLFYFLVVAAPPSRPERLAPHLLRLFPSTTFGLWTWLDIWDRTDPDAAIAWARWAQPHASNPVIFHVRAAQYLHARGNLAAAREELRAAEAKAHVTTRPSIAEIEKNLFPAP